MRSSDTDRPLRGTVHVCAHLSVWMHINTCVCMCVFEWVSEWVGVVHTWACALGSSLSRQPTCCALVWTTPAHTKFSGFGSTFSRRAVPNPNNYRHTDTHKSSHTQAAMCTYINLKCKQCVYTLALSTSVSMAWFALKIFCASCWGLRTQIQCFTHSLSLTFTLTLSTSHSLAELFPALKEVMWGHLSRLEELIDGDREFECKVLQSSTVPGTQQWCVFAHSYRTPIPLINKLIYFLGYKRVCYLNLMLRSGASMKSDRHSMLTTCCTWAPPSTRGSTGFSWTFNCEFSQGDMTPYLSCYIT